MLRQIVALIHPEAIYHISCTGQDGNFRVVPFIWYIKSPHSKRPLYSTNEHLPYSTQQIYSTLEKNWAIKNVKESYKCTPKFASLDNKLTV